MAINVIAGPGYSGKSQILRRVVAPGDVVLDTSEIWRGLYPEAESKRAVRTAEQARFTNLVKRSALDAAVRLGLSGWVTMATGDRATLIRWAAAASGDPDSPAPIYIYDPLPRAELEKRARQDGPLCDQIVGRWFDSFTREGTDQDFDPAEFREGGAEYRWADGEVATQWIGEADCELRAESTGRRVSGTAVVYGDEARPGPGWRERFEPGSIKVREGINLTVQHRRDQPIARPTFTDGRDRLTFEAEVAPGARGDQALADVRNGLLRGASLEFHARRARPVGTTRVIEKALVTGISLVDRPSYPESRIHMRAAPDRAAWWGLV